jgi:hypothetical protein
MPHPPVCATPCFMAPLSRAFNSAIAARNP